MKPPYPANRLPVWVLGITVSTTLLLGIRPAQGGAYPLKHGKKFIQVTGKYIYAENYYDSGTLKHSLSATSDLTANIFGEIGLAKKLSTTFNIQFYKYYITEGPSNFAPYDIIYSGPSDSDMGLKYGVIKNPFLKASLYGKIGLPLGLPFEDSRSKNAPVPLASSDFPFSLGGELDYKPLEVPLVLNLNLGFKARNYGRGVKNYSDATLFGAGAAYPYKQFYFILSGYGEFSHYNGAISKDISFFAFGPTVYAKLEKNLGLTAGVESATQNANTLSGLAYKGGVTLSY